jgi:hypothetical protein
MEYISHIKTNNQKLTKLILFNKEMRQKKLNSILMHRVEVCNIAPFQGLGFREIPYHGFHPRLLRFNRFAVRISSYFMNFLLYKLYELKMDSRCLGNDKTSYSSLYPGYPDSDFAFFFLYELSTLQTVAVTSRLRSKSGSS